MKYGCIGKKLTHSFSKEIHGMIADYEYELIELGFEEIDEFFAKKDFAAINVTIPYKQTVIKYLDFISPIAEKIGAVNTIVNRDGKLYGYNTDFYGLKSLIQRNGIAIKGKKVLILGTGGTSKTSYAVADDMGASTIIKVSRQMGEGHITYEQAVCLHSDADVIINTTPSGMYPDNESKPIDVFSFPKLSGVIDAVYNPLNTNLVLDARKKGIKAECGLYMLVTQAVAASEKFLGTSYSKKVTSEVFAKIYSAKENIVLTGMPGSGKSTVGSLIDIDGFETVDTDKEIEKRCGISIKELIERKGEKYFRDLESEVIRDVSQKSGLIISTGGGAVLRAENIRCLKQNGRIYFIDANPERLLATSDRPLSDTKDKLMALYKERKDIYESTCDVHIEPMESAEEEAYAIMKIRKELIR